MLLSSSDNTHAAAVLPFDFMAVSRRLHDLLVELLVGRSRHALLVPVDHRSSANHVASDTSLRPTADRQARLYDTGHDHTNPSGT